MRATSNIDALTRRARGRTSRHEVAADEARRRWETMRHALAEQADELAEVAGEQLREARDVAGPQVKRLRAKAAERTEPVTERIREELAEVSAELGPQVSRLLLDLKEASRGEAQRIVEAINRSADEALAEARAEERRRRTWALIGWTAFGLAAGALLASEYGKRQHEPAALPDIAQGQPARDQDVRVEDVRAQDARAQDVAVPVADGDLPTVPQALR